MYSVDLLQVKHIQVIQGHLRSGKVLKGSGVVEVSFVKLNREWVIINGKEVR